MAQDDAHLFLAPEQVDAELDRFFEMTGEVYEALGLAGVEVAVSTRPEQFVGEAADWEAAEARLLAAVERAGFPRRVKPGQAAFYGPKVECDFRDVLGRPWTLSTLQIDVAMPLRFGLRYVGADDELHTPAMLHRAVLGSLERFIALYTERTGGDFPLWLAPLQVLVLPITDRHLAYARSVERRLAQAGLRAAVDERNEKLGWKIREAELRKVPVMLVVGDQEQADGTATLRRRHAGGGQVAARVGELVAELAREVDERRGTRPAREE
jgi:threonyl-tRNA synthetase